MCLQLWQNSPLNPPSSRLPKRCKAAVGETLRAASGPLPGVWPGSKKGSVFATASYKHIVFLYLIGPYYLILVYKIHPFRLTPTQAQASVPEVAPGELQVDLDEICESENRFFRMRLWTTQIDALSTLIGTWHFHQTVDMFEGY